MSNKNLLRMIFFMTAPFCEHDVWLREAILTHFVTTLIHQFRCHGRFSAAIAGD
jgi:hypothetical protein